MSDRKEISDAAFKGSVIALAIIGLFSLQMLAIIKMVREKDPWYLVIFYSFLALGFFAIRPLLKYLKTQSKSKSCDHLWLDTDIPYVDLRGGWHTCVRCKEEKYIYWGDQYIKLEEDGKITDKWEN